METRSQHGALGRAPDTLLHAHHISLCWELTMSMSIGMQDMKQGHRDMGQSCKFDNRTFYNTWPELSVEPPWTCP